MKLDTRSAAVLTKLLQHVELPKGCIISDPDEYLNRCNRIAFLLYLALA